MRLATRDEWMNKRWIRPFRARLQSPLVWRFRRQSVARGLALGLFAAFAVPLAQTPFAAAFAVALRANLPVAAAATFVTNPLTMPFIYYLACQLGLRLLQVNSASLLAMPADAGLVERGLSLAATLAGPTFLGLLVFAGVSALAGFLSVHFGWRLAVRFRRWRRRSSHGAAPAVHA